MTARSEAFGLEVARLEEAKRTEEFRLRDAEYTLRTTPEQIAKIEKQIQELRKGREI